MCIRDSYYEELKLQLLFTATLKNLRVRLLGAFLKLTLTDTAASQPVATLVPIRGGPPASVLADPSWDWHPPPADGLEDTVRIMHALAVEQDGAEARSTPGAVAEETDWQGADVDCSRGLDSLTQPSSDLTRSVCRNALEHWCLVLKFARPEPTRVEQFV